MVWLVSAIFAAGLAGYNIATAPPEIPLQIAFSPAPVLDPYPELDGVKIHLNTASITELQMLPEIGKKRAQDIYDYIRKYGKITYPDQLYEISGLGKSTVKKISRYLLFD